MNCIKTHKLSCKSGPRKVTVYIVECQNGFWWALKGGHIAYFIYGRPFKSGTQINNVDSDDEFTYYGDGTDEHPDNIADVKTFLWLLQDK